MKRILLFALVLALLLTFVGCTGNGKDKSTNETETSASLAGKTESVPDAPSETKMETETETPGSAGKNIQMSSLSRFVKNIKRPW